VDEQATQKTAQTKCAKENIFAKMSNVVVGFFGTPQPIAAAA